jgi:hypothetical protein
LIAPQDREAEHLTLAFGLLHQLFGIPPLLDVDVVVAGQADEYSIITYLSLCAKYVERAQQQATSATTSAQSDSAAMDLEMRFAQQFCLRMKKQKDRQHQLDRQLQHLTTLYDISGSEFTV